MKRFAYILLIISLFVLKGEAQQAPLYSQYMLNGFLMNPAAAGSEGYTAINMTAREQWVGLQGGPSTYAMSFQTRFLEDSQIERKKKVRKNGRQASRGGRVGLGGYLFNYSNGAIDRTGIKLTYAYHLTLENSQLSFGLSLVGYQHRMDEKRITLENPDDPLWLGVRNTVFIPDADVGVYWSSRDFWLGFSVDQLLESAIKWGDEGYDAFVMERNYYLMGGYDFRINEDLTISPTAMVKVAENGRFQSDISGKFFFKETFWGGLTYRTGHSMILLAGISFDRLVFGYAYDIGLNSLMRHSYGSHEFTFAVKLGDIARRYRWLSRN